MTGAPAGKKFQAQHLNLANKPKPEVAPAVTFQQNKRIEGAQNWSGSQYTAFRNYTSEWHDQGWWRQRYNRVVLISGGWYYWNAGFWYPAWGYDSANAYYPYDGPIYGYNDLPPDQVIGNVQTRFATAGLLPGRSRWSARAAYACGDRGLSTRQRAGRNIRNRSTNAGITGNGVTRFLLTKKPPRNYFNGGFLRTEKIWMRREQP